MTLEKNVESSVDNEGLVCNFVENNLNPSNITSAVFYYDLRICGSC